MELNKQAKKVVNLLADGGKYSVIAIANALHIGDPRSVIRNIRKAGVTVSDEWRRTRDGKGQYKVYYINKADAARING